MHVQHDLLHDHSTLARAHSWWKLCAIIAAYLARELDASRAALSAESQAQFARSWCRNSRAS
jgi:hypothetical protein